MLTVKTEYDYNQIEKLLPEFYPAVKTKLHEESTEGAATVFTLEMSMDEFCRMTDALMDLEVAVSQVPAGGEQTSLAYRRNIKYGWLWDMFYEAEIVER